MSRSATFDVTCDIDGTVGQVLVNVSDPSEDNGWTKEPPGGLPNEWMSLDGKLFGPTFNFNESSVVVCPACVATVKAALPGPWQVVFPPTPS